MIVGMIRLSDPDASAAARARCQEGVLSHAQAIAVGLSDDQIGRRCAARLWLRPVTGVYVVAGSPDTAAQRAWVAYLACASSGGILSHVTAAAVLGLCPHSVLPHVTVAPGASARCRAAKVHRATVPEVDRMWRDGLRLTSASRTLVDLAAVLDRSSLEEIVDAALCRRLATHESVRGAAARAGRRRRGAALLAGVLAAWSPQIEPGSVAEVRLMRLLGELGISGLVSQHDVVDDAGAFVARLDLADPARRRGFEYDGVEAHNPRRWTRDEPRYARLRALGWRVDPVTKLDLLPGEPRLRQLVADWHVRTAG
jgi:hypothetical protein